MTRTQPAEFPVSNQLFLASPRASFLVFIIAAVLLFCMDLPVSAQTVKARVASITLEATGFAKWPEELGYQESDLYPLNISDSGCPFVDVGVSGTHISLMLDTGTSRGLVLTNHAPAFRHRVEERHEELNADGSRRGESVGIRIDALSVLGQTFKNVGGSLSDWKMFSSEPFDGTVGLDFFLERRLTLDYRSRRVGVTASPLPMGLDGKHYLAVDLVQPPRSQGHILYVRARVNRREAIVYLDTGYNVSFIDPEFARGLARIERPGKFKTFRNGVPLELGGHRLVLNDLREDPVRRGSGFDLPVALILGSDILSRFIVTIDLRVGKLVLAFAD